MKGALRIPYYSGYLLFFRVKIVSSNSNIIIFKTVMTLRFLLFFCIFWLEKWRFTITFHQGIQLPQTKNLQSAYLIYNRENYGLCEKYRFKYHR